MAAEGSLSRCVHPIGNAEPSVQTSLPNGTADARLVIDRKMSGPPRSLRV